MKKLTGTQALQRIRRIYFKMYATGFYVRHPKMYKEVGKLYNYFVRFQ